MSNIKIKTEFAYVMSNIYTYKANIMEVLAGDDRGRKGHRTITRVKVAQINPVCRSASGRGAARRFSLALVRPSFLSSSLCHPDDPSLPTLATTASGPSPSCHEEQLSRMLFPRISFPLNKIHPSPGHS